MKRTAWLLAAVLLAPELAVAGPPDRVPPLTRRVLSESAYVELARAWKEYMDGHGETVEGLVNLGMAYGYSNQLQAAAAAGRRAVELGPDDPDALAFLGKTLNSLGSPLEETEPLLQHCIELAPGHESGLMTLAGIYLRNGRLENAAGVLKGVFERRLIARPLQDYAYNMLLGLPTGAILITNGDNDTFPPLALQAGMKFRTDVILVNRNLLYAPEYAEAVMAAHPELRVPIPEATDKRSRSILDLWLEMKPTAVFFAATTSIDDLDVDPESWVLEGLNRRAAGGGLSPDDNARLLLDRYRLDSATDWNYAWDLAPAVTSLMKNYPAALMRAAQRTSLSPALRTQLLDQAADIARFHEMNEVLTAVEKLQHS